MHTCTYIPWTQEKSWKQTFTPLCTCTHMCLQAYTHFFIKFLDFATLIQHEITQKLEWSSHIRRDRCPHEKGKSKEPRGSSWSLSVCLPRGGREPVKIFKPRIISTRTNSPELFCFGNIKKKLRMAPPAPPWDEWQTPSRHANGSLFLYGDHFAIISPGTSIGASRRMRSRRYAV